ncbi:hypothetical protein ANTPLA_LOCUS2879 [Anthophora plagiata]
MEVDTVIEKFQRSQTLHQMKYVNYLGDGDSKTFKGVIDAKPYENFTVLRKQCIDHVQKRVGIRLRNLKKKTKCLVERGKLTGKLIDELSIYYRLGIRRNCDSQKAKATNTLDNYKHKPAVSNVVYKAIKSLNEELSSNNLLTRCIGGFTQNGNEGFNSTVWTLNPKSISSGKIVLDVATNIGVCIFNDGHALILYIIDVTGMKIGPNSYNMCLDVDARRVKLAEKSLSEAAKQTRMSLKTLRKETQEQVINLGGQLYGAGIAD